MLSDLVVGHGGGSAEKLAGSGVASLIQPAAARPMSLPSALNAMRAGTLRPPTEGAIGEVLAPDMSAPQPRPYRGEVNGAEVAARTDRLEMQARIRAKREALQASSVYSNDALANQRDAQRRHEVMRRLNEAEAQLMNGEMTNV